MGSEMCIRDSGGPLRGHQRAPQRPSEVLSGSSEVIRGTQRHSEVIRDHSEPLRATQWHSAALRGARRALGTRSSPPLTLRSVQAPCPSHLLHPRHPPPLLAAVFHAQTERTPLHVAAWNSSSVAVVQALLAANPEAAMATTNVRRPSPLAAWMRGPERSSEVIICNQGQSGVIIRNQRALSGTQRALSATRWPLGGPLRGHHRAPQRPSEVLSGSSEVIRATQRHSVAFSGTQRHAEGPRHAVFTAPRPA